MKSTTYRELLTSILETIEEFEGFIGNMPFEEFSKDKTTQTLTVQSIQIIAEATKHIPQTVKIENPQIPWEQLSAMSDPLVLRYFEFDTDTLYKTAQQTIRRLKAPIENMLEKTDPKTNQKIRGSLKPHHIHP